MLAHEYVHHVQFAHESFPFLITREVDEENGTAQKYPQTALLFDRFIRRFAYYGVAAFCC